MLAKPAESLPIQETAAVVYGRVRVVSPVAQAAGTADRVGFGPPLAHKRHFSPGSASLPAYVGQAQQAGSMQCSLFGSLYS